MEDRDLSSVVQVKGDTTAHPADAAPEVVAYGGVGRRPKPRYRTSPQPVRELVLAVGRGQVKPVAWREGSRGGKLRSRFVVMPVRPAGRKIRRAHRAGELPLRLLIAEWPARAPEPIKYWLTNLPHDTPRTRLVRLAKLRWCVEHDDRELGRRPRLDHYEGRTWRGWHHHVTLVSSGPRLLHPAPPATATSPNRHQPNKALLGNEVTGEPQRVNGDGEGGTTGNQRNPWCAPGARVRVRIIHATTTDSVRCQDLNQHSHDEKGSAYLR